MYKALATLFLTAVTAASSAIADARQVTLIMIEEPGCVYCARWNAEIAPIYPKTGEGQAAPLLRMDITAPAPDDMMFQRPVVYTPTFVLMVDGHETSRLEGYPGEDFFWGLLGEMLTQSAITFDPDPSKNPTN